MTPPPDTSSPAVPPHHAGTARYVMIGGFLGAGKTTAMSRLGHMLRDRGLRVGLITNDQSAHLVDTALLRKDGFAVEEIAGGCFCCRFDSLHEAATRLTDAEHPELFLAEPVGSCTDLIATVSYPMRRMYGNQYRIAPLSVLVDPRRAARILGVRTGKSFSPKVAYVYRKQLEEADLIVVNKCDAAAGPGQPDDTLVADLVAALRAEYPHAQVFTASARTGDGMEPWLDAILSGEGRGATAMQVDYQVYAEGEAELGWLNATVQLTADHPVDGNLLLVQLTDRLRHALAPHGEIAHLKLTLEGDGQRDQLAVVSVTHNTDEPDLRESLLGELRRGTLVVNLRAETAPEHLAAALDAVLHDAPSGVSLELEHCEHFRPAPPVPTHRDSERA